MTDLTESFDFTAATNAAIEAAETPAEVETPEAAEVEQPEAEAPENVVEENAHEADDRPRNPDGTFAAKTPEPDLTEELETLRKRLADKDEFISRQGNELGDLRKELETRFDTLEQRTSQRVSADLIDTDPATATRIAWDQNDQVALGAAFSAWKDEDPAAAGAWAAYTAAEQKMAEQAARYDAKIAELEGRVQTIQQATTDQQDAVKARAIAEKYGADAIMDFVQNGAFEQLAEEFPWAQTALATDAAGTIESLFLVHRGRTADTLTKTQEQVARETAEQAEQATSDAYVASASTATATTAEQKTEAELIAEGMTARIQAKNSLWREGWEGRDDWDTLFQRTRRP